MNVAPSQQELLDLVDEHDVVIGQVSRAEAWQNRLPIRVINAFLVDSTGLLWIPRRTQHKVMFPGCLDVSVGGHVVAGESYLEAFQRETKEELNLDLAALMWREVAVFSPFDTTLSAFMRVYEISYQATPAYNSDDFCKSFWLQPRELERRIRAGEPAKGDLLELVQRIFFKGASKYV
jgi:isopentenyldiphosphate isomerase